MTVPNDDALGVAAKVVEENGRWAVYLGVDFWDASAHDNPVETVWHRINDYATPEAAAVAAQWYQRGANRSRRRPETEEFGGND